jgi:hypothetical protein
MPSQQIIGQSKRHQSSAEIPDSQRVYAFDDLPEVVRENLLRLQNTDGDFLRLSNSVTAGRVAWLCLLSIGFLFFLASFEFVSFDLKWILVFSSGASIFLLWFVYLIWKIYGGIRAPIKNQIYLTPTQVIETTDGFVRYRELKDAAGISVNKYWNDNGRSHTLDIAFTDGDAYQYKLAVVGNSAQLSETKQWEKTASAWRDEAASAFLRGDAEYFNSRDVLPKSATTTAPVLKKNSLNPLRRVLLKITFAVFAAGCIVYLLIK